MYYSFPTFYHMLTTFTIFSHLDLIKLHFDRNVAQKRSFVLLTEKMDDNVLRQTE